MDSESIIAGILGGAVAGALAGFVVAKLMPAPTVAAVKQKRPLMGPGWIGYGYDVFFEREEEITQAEALGPTLIGGYAKS